MDFHHPQAEFMCAALEQAQLALDAGNLPIGAVIVHNNQIISAACNAIVFPANDTQHAELLAIQQVAGFLAEHKHQCTLYTTLEPCMMCLGAIINVGIDTLVVAQADNWVGALNLLPHGEYYCYKQQQMTIVTGVMAAQSQQLLKEYVRRTGTRQHLAAPINPACAAADEQ